MEESKRNYIPFIVAAIYAAVTLICVFHHEVWSDEAQVWLLAKNLSFFGLFKHLVNEGHPSLFYLMVMPFAKLSDNIIWQKLICWGSMVLAVFLLWRYTKFSNAAKIIITISSPFLYHFPVIARNYSLVAPIIIGLAVLYNKSDKRPILYSILIALLANTHAIMFPFAGLLGAEFIFRNLFIEKRKNKSFVVAYSIITFGLVALVAQLIGTTSSNVAINFDGENKGNWESALRVILVFIYNSFDDYFIKSQNNYFTIYPLTMFLLSILGYVFSFVFLYKNNKKLFTYASLGILAQFFIYIFTYNFFIFPTRIYCAYLILLFGIIAVIQLKDNEKTKLFANFAVILLFGLTLINSFKSYYGDIMFDYTPSCRTAEFMKNNINPKNSDIFIDDQGYAIALAYYLYPEKELYFVGDGKPLKYVRWIEYKRYSADTWLSYFQFLRKQGNKKELYAVVNFNPLLKGFGLDMPREHFDLMYVTPNAMASGEYFELYKYKD